MDKTPRTDRADGVHHYHRAAFDLLGDGCMMR